MKLKAGERERPAQAVRNGEKWGTGDTLARALPLAPSAQETIGAAAHHRNITIVDGGGPATQQEDFAPLHLPNLGQLRRGAPREPVIGTPDLCHLQHQIGVANVAAGPYLVHPVHTHVPASVHEKLLHPCSRVTLPFFLHQLCTQTDAFFTFPSVEISA